MSSHRYPARTLGADYARALTGLALTGGPLMLGAASPVAIAVLGALAILFIAYAGRAAMRQFTRYEVSAEGLKRAPPLGLPPRHIAWNELSRLRLRYYSMRRGSRDGWMQVVLAGAGRRIALESAIEDFDAIVEHAAEVAAARGLAPDSATLDNLAALGICWRGRLSEEV